MITLGAYVIHLAMNVRSFNRALVSRHPYLPKPGLVVVLCVGHAPFRSRLV